MTHPENLNRALLVLAFMWGSAAVVILAYWGWSWEKKLEPGAARFAMHCARLLAPIGGGDLVDMQSRHSEIGVFVRTDASHQSAAAGGPRVRSSSLLSFERRVEAGLVSVIIPTHNRAQIIRRAIESALGQTYPTLEVIVADDGSTDDTKSVVEGYRPRVVYIRQANAGVSAARNFGLRHARGEFVAFLDSDDMWRPWKVETQLAALALRPEAGVVWTDMAAVDEGDCTIESRYLREMYSAYRKLDFESTLTPLCELGSLSSSVPDEFAAAAVRGGDLSSAILMGNLIHTSTVLFRRAWCERTGGFDESFARAGEDYEFYIRLTSAGPVVFIDAPSTLYRIGAADQLTAPAMLLEIARNNLRAVQKWLPVSGSQINLTRREIRERFAESFAWLGEVELDAGHAWLAARRLSRSLRVLPRFDRRAVLLASCVLPPRLREGIRSAREALRSGSTGDVPAATT